jgi:hypothetical protein
VALKLGVAKPAPLTSAHHLPSPIPSAVGPHFCGAGVVQGVKVERATVRTTLTPWVATARLARGDGRRDGSPPLTATNPPAPAGPCPSRSLSAPAGGIVLTSAVRFHLAPPASKLRARAASAGPSGAETGATARPGAGRAPGGAAATPGALNL